MQYKKAFDIADGGMTREKKENLPTPFHFVLKFFFCSINDRHAFPKSAGPPRPPGGRGRPAPTRKCPRTTSASTYRTGRGIGTCSLRDPERDRRRFRCSCTGWDSTRPSPRSEDQRSPDSTGTRTPPGEETKKLVSRSSRRRLLLPRANGGPPFAKPRGFPSRALRRKIYDKTSSVFTRESVSFSFSLLP